MNITKPEMSKRANRSFFSILDAIQGEHGPFVVHVYGEAQECATAGKAARVAAIAEDYAEGFVQITADGCRIYGRAR